MADFLENPEEALDIALTAIEQLCAVAQEQINSGKNMEEDDIEIAKNILAIHSFCCDVIEDDPLYVGGIYHVKKISEGDTDDYHCEGLLENKDSLMEEIEYLMDGATGIMRMENISKKLNKLAA